MLHDICLASYPGRMGGLGMRLDICILDIRVAEWLVRELKIVDSIDKIYHRYFYFYILMT